MIMVKPNEYPSLNNLSKADYAYIDNRLQKTKNPCLIIKYAHLLWLSLHKKIGYANKALEQYLKLINRPALVANNGGTYTLPSNGF